ncbi:Serine carboxypeptidase 3 [Nakaseomyces glabratus]|nr:Serine carboxypeptidase 3 [Nakaseomyces glabratus]
MSLYRAGWRRALLQANGNSMMHIHSRSLLHTTRLVQQSVEESGKSTGIKHKNIRAHKLAHSKYEDKSYQLPKWKEALGEFVVRTFKLDMDKVRAGPVAGSYYYNLCKQQGLQYEDEEMSETAKFFYEELGLPRTFSQWFQITVLHEWILFVRIRAMPFQYGRNYQQKLVDRTFSDIEVRLFEEMNVNSGRIADQYMKDFNAQLRGAVFAYDEGFFTDDATLAKAIWRNLYAGKPNVDITHLEKLVKYVRGQLYVLSQLSDREFAMGQFKFVSPNEIVEKLTPEQEQLRKEKVIEKYEKMDKDPHQLPSDKSNLSYTN